MLLIIFDVVSDIKVSFRKDMDEHSVRLPLPVFYVDMV